MTTTKNNKPKSIRGEVEELLEKYELPEPKELEYQISEFDFKHEQLKQDIITIYKARYEDSQDFKKILRALVDIIETDENIIENEKRQKREYRNLLYGYCAVILFISVFSLLF